jgi:hypothetical protein
MKTPGHHVALTLLLTLLSLVALPRTATPKEKEVTIRGYVTAINPPTSFEIEDYRITSDSPIQIEVEYQWAGFSFKPEYLRVGLLMEIRGRLNEETNEIKPTRIKVDLRQFRDIALTTILERKQTQLEQLEAGKWRGFILADGRRIRIEPETQVFYGEAMGARPLTSLNDLGPGVSMTYRGKEQVDGTVLASKVTFFRNEREKGEKDLWGTLEAREKPANFLEGKPGELRVGADKYKVLPNKEVQDYVERLGRLLVPAFQKAMSSNDPNKIPFHFVVVVEKEFNAYAYSNGTVVVNSGVFDVLENEAQLAAVLAHEIAHATQEHTYRQLQRNRQRPIEFAPRSRRGTEFYYSRRGMEYDYLRDELELVYFTRRNGYSLTLENQADRVGMEYLVDAGYDPREAPKVWKLALQKFGDNNRDFFWSNHYSNSERRSFQMVTISTRFRDLDFSGLRTNEDEYKRMVQLAAGASAKKK